MFYVYAIKNVNNGKIYIGQTSDLENRLKRHNGLLKSRLKSYTGKNRGVWVLCYKESLSTREEAMRREKELKSFRGREFVRSKLI